MAKIAEVTLKDIQEAKKFITNVINKTNLIYSEAFSEISGNKVYIKPENFQIVGSYKIRGAYNKIGQLSKEEKKNGLITASAGNHAQGVAYAAAISKTPAIVVMPKDASLVKIKRTEELGAKVILHGNCFDEACEYAAELAQKNDYTYIHAFNDPKIIAGQGTIGLEILEEIRDIDVFFIPIGGGGLISGISTAAKSINPKIKIIGVEPIGAASAKESLEAGKATILEKVSTIADGVAVKAPGDLTFKIIKNNVDEVITVSDTEIMEAFLILLEKHKIVAEPAGAVALAGILSKKINLKNKKIAAILSGGNVDLLTISALVNRGLIRQGRIFEFSLDIPNKYGELYKISKILADNQANIIKIEHNQFKSIERYNKTRLSVIVETSGHNHIKKIKQSFKKGGYHAITIG